tara:strand:+ start:851 stop:1030 length:180 start_codon:yes stop_codon:yes gene_type:complete
LSAKRNPPITLTGYWRAIQLKQSLIKRIQNYEKYLSQQGKGIAYLYSYRELCIPHHTSI